MSGSSAVGATGLALMSAPEWSIFVAGGVAVLFAAPALTAVRSWRRLGGVTLPLSLPARRVLPDPDSAAREPMERLMRSERALYGILGVLSRAGTVGAEDIENTDSTARSAAQALEAVAIDIASMEDATRGARQAAPALHRAIASAAGQLDDGVAQFEKFVAAAAEVAGPGATSGAGGLSHVRDELLSATEKLSGLAAALEEIDDIVRRYR
ncbi:hypothetical protein [Rhodococcus sp. NPDC049939]|uniref:phage shock envelope stress response protein PspM n=1 Tax=Rhodococcus sp. NPDC049939 TaxID=3155511 RepID=UPI0033C27340